MTAFIAVKYAVAIAFICATVLTSGWAQDVSNDSQANAVISSCGENEFRCRNGDCIKSEVLCDGRADCSDNSDETEAECTKPELTCPEYTFRCAYGACVDGDAACNGVKDCIDNSDETLPRCAVIAPNAPPESVAAGFPAAESPAPGGFAPGPTCGIDDYRCQNGQCISSTSLCDGVVDCSDGSDETLAKCGSFSCGQLVFRCNYGACIDGDLKCNNVSNCADASDEDPALCGVVNPGPTPRPTPRPTPTPSPTPPGPTPARPSACVVPPQPKNGERKLHKSQCSGWDSGSANCEISQGTVLEPGSQLVYTCSPGYKARGTTDVYCSRGGTWSSLPVCIEIKCSALNSPSTSTDCFTRSGGWISCDSPVPPGTRAQVSCRSGYRKDTNAITTQRESVECSSNGKWAPDPIKCIPVCGKTINHQTPLVVNGVPAQLGDFPWHATLYVERRTSKGLVKEFHCGATIIQSNLLMTAAHCIYDEITRTTTDPNTLFVMTGNVFRDFDSPLHNEVTVRKGAVKNVYRPCKYYGLIGNYAADIAILELKEAFQLSDILQPACLDVSGEDSQILEQGSFGKVAGFGRTLTGSSSAILQTIRIPYVPYSVCKNSTTIDGTNVFIGTDKFCGGYKNGSAVCEGDSGGGLVFQKGDLWYVLGIVSVGLGVDTSTGERMCDKYSYSLYTKVTNYMTWMQRIMFELEQYKSYPSCNSDDTSFPNRGDF